MQQIDESYERSFLASRRDDIYVAEIVRAPPGDEAPFNTAGDTFAAAISAVARACNVEAPGFSERSDPEAVFRWVADSILNFGEEMANEGRALERERVGVPLNARKAKLAFTLMNTLNELLTNR
ncbi:MAG: hypothetical protein CMI16_09750 [Opitutaceae bacterium]|nr:hypothetical protein [Opitutaceae bacterium]